MLLHLLLCPSAVPVEEDGQLEATNHIEDEGEEGNKEDEKEEDEEEEEEEEEEVEEEYAGGVTDLKEDPRLMILGFSLLMVGVSVHLGMVGVSVHLATLDTNSYKLPPTGSQFSQN